MMILKCATLAGVLATLVTATAARTAPASKALPVAEPPEAFFERVPDEDREVARSFYRKYVDVQGMPVVAADEVADEALQRTHEIVTHMLAGRPDVVQALIDRGMYLIIIGKDQQYTDMPEYRNRANKEYLNERVRGTGGLPTSFGEENLLSLPLDRYDDESIAVHEFCHTIDGVLRWIDPDWNDRKRAAYQQAMDQGLYRNAYAAGNAGEYWAEIAQAYFDCNRVNNWNHIHVGNREQLKHYDPAGYELVRSAFNLSPEQDWRYTWIQTLPNVTAPPARFEIDPYYTKFTWAREFTVLGREASDAALLQANDTIRKMFAYRHDILKALIADGVRVVVLGRDESIADLPEYRDAADRDGIDALSRTLAYAPATRLLVVGEENVLGDPRDPGVGECHLIRLFADAIYQVTATRPVDPDWENRGRDVQQYELRVQRLDERFGEAVQTLYAAALSVGQWPGTSAIHGHAEYWTAGVLAYFDAAGQAAAPPDALHPITTRESLRAYDPKLYELVDDTMAYHGHVDWRHPR